MQTIYLPRCASQNAIFMGRMGSTSDCSQQCQKGRTVALEQLTPKSLGVSAATMIRDGPGHYLATRERVYDQLLIIVNNQMETTSDPGRMTRYERANYDKAGQCFILIHDPLSKRQLMRRLFFTQPTKSVGKRKKRRLYAKSWTTSEKKKRRMSLGQI
jgi:hypothetical protein